MALRSIPIKDLQPGFQLPGPLCDKSGRMLLPSGVVLNDAHLEMLARTIATGKLFTDGDWPGLDPVTPTATPDDEPTRSTVVTEPVSIVTKPEPFRTVSVDTLRVGSRLAHSICDTDGVLLLAAGSQITSRFMQLLGQRQIRFVQLQPQAKRPTKYGESESAARLDQVLSAELAGSPILTPSDLARRAQLPLEDLWAEARRGLEIHTESSETLAGITDSLMHGRTVSGDKMKKLVTDFADMLTIDCDLLATIVGMQRDSEEYLFDHGINVALLSMSIAAQLGFTREQIHEIGVGAVFQDIGMLRIPDDIRTAPRSLTSRELWEVHRHPIYTLDYLERLRGLNIASRFVGMQSHERMDGRGYPRGRKSATIHPYARIVAVADVYHAMIRRRPYRPATIPHDAIRQILQAGNQNCLDRVTLRAFLDIVSVFPVGTMVELKKGVIGQVIRANPGQHTRPVIVELDKHQRPTDWVIDLSQESALKVIKAGPLIAKTGTILTPV